MTGDLPENWRRVPVLVALFDLFQLTRQQKVTGNAAVADLIRMQIQQTPGPEKDQMVQVLLDMLYAFADEPDEVLDDFRTRLRESLGES